MAADAQPLSIREKIAYGLGDSAANFVGATQNTFLLFFYTDIFGISAHTAGAILLWSRVVDAFNDPIVGALADRTSSRWGKYRPWILLTAVPLALALVLCYTTPELDQFGKVVWAIITYNLLMILYAANNIPYCALSGVITSDSDERTNLATWRFLCAMAAILIVTTSSMDLVEIFGRGDRAAGFQATAAAWGAVALVCLVVTFLWTRERVADSPRQKSNIRQDIVDLLRNRPWLALFLLSIFISAQNALRSGTSLYYFEHFQRAAPILKIAFGNSEVSFSNFGLFNAVGLLTVMLGVLLSSPLSRRFGKRNTFRACLLTSAALMAAFVLLPREATFTLFALQIAMQLAFAPTIPLLWSMMADVADYGEWKNGRRSTALAFASIVFGMKVGGGLGGWLGGELLHRAGYVARAIPGNEALATIARLVSVYPALALVIGAIALLFYNIDRTTELEMERSLRERRDAGAAVA